MLIDPRGDPTKKVNYEIASDESEGRLRGVPIEFLIRREGWQLKDDESQLWSVQAGLAKIDDHSETSWIEVFVSRIGARDG